MAIGKSRKIQRLMIVVDVEQTGNAALGTKPEIADGLVASLPGTQVDLEYGKEDPERGRKRQSMVIIGAYSKLATVEGNRKGPDLNELRSTPAS